MHDLQTAGDALVAGLKSELLTSQEASSKLQQQLNSLQVCTLALTVTMQIELYNFV